MPHAGRAGGDGTLQRPLEPGMHLGPVEVKPEWGMPHGEGVQGLDQGTEEQLNQDPGAGTQAFQEQGKTRTVRN